MAFRLDDIIIDRIQYGVATNFNDELLYTLTQLSEASINITADSTDSVDKMGTLIKRFWRGKQGEFTATNAMINLNIIGAESGNGKEYASSENPIVMPKIITVKAGTATTELGKNVVKATVKIVVLHGNGAQGKTFVMDTDYSVSDTGTLTLPKNVSADDMDATNDVFLVKFNRTVSSSGVRIQNKADAFPQTVHLTLKALAVDPCNTDQLKACYIYLPSFQPSPEQDMSFTTDATMDYSGSLQVDYCSADKVLYEIYWCDDDDEEV